MTRHRMLHVVDLLGDGDAVSSAMRTQAQATGRRVHFV